MYRAAESGVHSGVQAGVHVGVSVVVANAVIQGLNAAGREAKNAVSSQLSSMRQERQDTLLQQAQVISGMLTSSTSENDGCFEELVIEYQRKIPMKGFKHDHLFPNEAKFRCLPNC